MWLKRSLVMLLCLLLVQPWGLVAQSTSTPRDPQVILVELKKELKLLTQQAAELKIKSNLLTDSYKSALQQVDELLQQSKDLGKQLLQEWETSKELQTEVQTLKQQLTDLQTELQSLKDRLQYLETANKILLGSTIVLGLIAVGEGVAIAIIKASN